MDINDFHAICINLDSRPDRWLESQIEFKKAGLNVTRISATNHHNPVIGCGLSHFKTLEELHNVNKHIIIFEDDVKFIYEINLQHYFDALPQQWDMLYLGANITTPIYKINPFIGKLTGAQSTHAYIVNKKFIPTILAHSLLVGKHMDLIYTENIIPYNNCFITIPLLAIQRPSYSDIEKRYVDYSWMVGRYNSNLQKG